MFFKLSVLVVVILVVWQEVRVCRVGRQLRLERQNLGHYQTQTYNRMWRQTGMLIGLLLAAAYYMHKCVEWLGLTEQVSSTVVEIHIIALICFAFATLLVVIVTGDRHQRVHLAFLSVRFTTFVVVVITGTQLFFQLPN